jgi:pimeloyl-ACP methyl ester carboxylesterase
MASVSENKSTTVRSTVRRRGRRGAWQARLAGAVSRAAQKLAPRAVGRAAEALFCTPRRSARPAHEARILADATPFTIPFEGDRLAGWSWGAGPTVLLVHGWNGRGAQLGALVEPLVAAGFRVVTFDGPAHGATGGRRATLASFSRAIVAVTCAVGPLHGVVAHSFGGAAATLALAGGVSAERVVLISPFTRIADGVSRFTGALGLGGVALQTFHERLAARAGSVIAALEPLAVAPRLEARALVVHDEEDREVRFGDGAAIAAAWPGAELVATHGLGHQRILRDPEIVKLVVAMLAAGIELETPVEKLEAELWDPALRAAASTAAVPRVQ